MSTVAPAVERESWQDYLDEVNALLWPPPAYVERSRRLRCKADQVLADFVFVPSRGNPRMILPRTPRQVAAAAIPPHLGDASPARRIQHRALRWGLGIGGARLLPGRVRMVAPRDAQLVTIQTYLCEALGQPVYVGVRVGPPRANRKPVVQALLEDGTTLAFVKVGANHVTRPLVRTEGDHLVAVAARDLRIVLAPKVLHQGRWGDLEVLALSALPVQKSRPCHDQADLVTAMRELAVSPGIAAGPLPESSFWFQLRRRAALAAPDLAPHLTDLVSRLERRIATLVCPLGAWHGDWTPWNCATVPGRVLLWDWERYAEGVPAGMDALHYRFQEVKTSMPRASAVRLMHDQAAALLAPFGIHPDDAPAIALCYALEVATRYASDANTLSDATRSSRNSPMLDALIESVEHGIDHVSQP
jgi:hypothetical protein